MRAPALPPDSSSAPLAGPIGTLPAAARQVGIAGSVAFGLGALLVWFVNAEARYYVTLGLAAYAALLVSFLGGVHWGLALRVAAPPPSLFLWATLATVLAWVAIVMPPAAGLVLDGVLLVVAYLVDRRVYPRYGLAHWLTLRFRQSAIAAFSCFLGAAGTS